MQNVYISHEMRTPVQSILGLTDLLLQMPITEQQRRITEHIHFSGTCLLDAINNMLDFSKIQTHTFSLNEHRYDIRTLITGIIDIINIRICEKNLCFTVDIPHTLPRFFIGDMNRIRQIVLNILTNAIKFTNQGFIVLKFRYANAKLHIEVSDSGIGIPHNDIPHLFREYFRGQNHPTTSSNEGYGLGLSICSVLVDKMHGSITVHSKEGEGSTFTVHIPQKNAELFQSIVSIPPTLPYSSALIYDPEAHTALHIQKQLQRLHLSSYCCSDISDFERHLQNKQAQTIVFFDYNSASTLVEKMRTSQKNAHDKTMYAALVSCADILTSSKPPERFMFLIRPVTIMNISNLLSIAPYQKRECTPKPFSLPHVHNCEALVVDDNEINRMVTGEFLHSIGFSVDEAVSGFEALQCAAQKKYDIILLDYVMSGMNGFETAKQLRSLGGTFAQVPIIALSADPSPEFEEQCIISGINDCMHKPIGLSSFISILKKWIPLC